MFSALMMTGALIAQKCYISAGEHWRRSICERVVFYTTIFC
jgi:hypothetical protein